MSRVGVFGMAMTRLAQHLSPVPRRFAPRRWSAIPASIRAVFAGGGIALVVSSTPLAAGHTAVPLDPATAVTRQLPAGQVHTYAIELEQGSRLRLTALQKGIDLVLTALGPGGEKLAEVDGPTGSWGAETLTLTAATPGRYTFEVKPLEPDVAPGRYELRVEALLSPELARRYVEVPLSANEVRPLLGTYEISIGAKSSPSATARWSCRERWSCPRARDPSQPWSTRTARAR